MDRYALEVSGGCQCGAVRYHTTEMMDNSHICHCRMCQKAVGNVFAALVAAPRETLVWTRGTPARFRSSDHVDRGFCRDCGTPLFYDDITGNRVNLTIGSLDNPDLFPPGANTGQEGEVSWFRSLTSIPDGGATETGQEKWASAIKATNHQHPDHDTADWPLPR
ncbi:aldehyde-activating protein [Devosia epidermidihirudinis]|uniref:Aldehyde-activating protein n=1 Tax=Devosia epidermidihirudinis TaxID=1293439 RepID=A0A0F5QFP4_9HYPH|nr:GFA family protein [Devosia epidermidihirudinis]KKC39770.1 aldehyde-activating protein [Devosia epidermidihirudinis]